MASTCFTPIWGRRMRATRVGTTGRFTPGPCSTVVTGGFVSIEMTSEVEEGEETTVRTAGGTLCVSEKGADQLKWLNVTIQFCNVDPDLLAMINPTWTKLLDYRGETIGWEESHEYAIDTGFALEVWSDVSGYVATDPNAEGAWVYYLLPFIVGGTLGDITIENAAVSFTITGRTKKGSQWGRGPYDVMANPPDGRAGPLLTPFSPDAPRRIFLTTIRPPEEVCGCQPLSSPDGPQITVTEDTTDANRMTVQTYASGLGPYTVDWGDGTVENLPPGLTGRQHNYGASGDYTITVHPTGDPTKATFATVTLPYSGTIPQQPLLVDVAEDTEDPSRTSATVEWNNTGFGTVRLSWGDGTPGLTAQAETGEATHQYAESGQYTVTVTDETDSTRTVSRTVVTPFGLLLTAVPDETDVDRRTVLATVNNGTKGSVTINWGDGSATTGNPGDGTTASRHKYGQAGTYTLTVVDADDNTRRAETVLNLPFALPQPDITLTEDTSDPTMMTVEATVDNHDQGSVTINWGDSSATTDNPGDGTTVAVHQYTDDGTYTVTATDTDNPAITASEQVTLPYDGGLALTATVAELDPADPTRRAVTLTWDNQGQGPVEITWGEDGETPTPEADSGTLDHTYAEDGTYTVTVTDANNGARTTTEDVTVPFTG